MNHSTISIILKNKNNIMEHVKSAVPMMSTIILKKCGKMLEEMEKLLSVWMQDQDQHPVLLSLMMIQEKAESLYEDLKKKHGKESEVHLLILVMAGFIDSRLEPTFTTYK